MNIFTDLLRKTLYIVFGVKVSLNIHRKNGNLQMNNERQEKFINNERNLAEIVLYKR